MATQPQARCASQERHNYRLPQAKGNSMEALRPSVSLPVDPFGRPKAAQGSPAMSLPARLGPRGRRRPRVGARRLMPPACHIRGGLDRLMIRKCLEYGAI